MVQYSFGTNASISASRSQTSRSAADCTLPALRTPGICSRDRRKIRSRNRSKGGSRKGRWYLVQGRPHQRS